MKASRRLLVAAAVACALPLSLRGAESSPAAGPAVPVALSLEAIEVEPAATAADTLHQLRVRIRNEGDRPASYLAFRVRVGTHDLVVYRNLVYLQALPPKASAEVRLHNFWSSETGRPFPSDGKLTVEVTVAEAKWVRVDTKDGIESTTPLEAIAGLPVSRTLTLSGGKR